jgi:uncharacterized coiled-coil DUF342 family protein
MDKTKVDDMLLEMITPKVKEIEEKFSRGEGLTQDDINTLLLKSQYNHINHLDMKLDETVASVKELEGKFTGLEGKFTGLEGKFTGLEGKFELLQNDLYNKFELLEEKVEHTIQKALNKNMVLLFFMMGVFLTLSKIIDKFF